MSSPSKTHPSPQESREERRGEVGSKDCSRHRRETDSVRAGCTGSLITGKASCARVLRDLLRGRSLSSTFLSLIKCDVLHFVDALAKMFRSVSHNHLSYFCTHTRESYDLLHIFSEFLTMYKACPSRRLHDPAATIPRLARPESKPT